MSRFQNKERLLNSTFNGHLGITLNLVGESPNFINWMDSSNYLEIIRNCMMSLQNRGKHHSQKFQKKSWRKSKNFNSNIQSWQARDDRTTNFLPAPAIEGCRQTACFLWRRVGFLGICGASELIRSNDRSQFSMNISKPWKDLGMWKFESMKVCQLTTHVCLFACSIPYMLHVISMYAIFTYIYHKSKPYIHRSHRSMTVEHWNSQVMALGVVPSEATFGTSCGATGRSRVGDELRFWGPSAQVHLETMRV